MPMPRGRTKSWRYKRILKLIDRVVDNEDKIMDGITLPTEVEYIVFTDASIQGHQGPASIGIIISNREGKILLSQAYQIDDQEFFGDINRLEGFTTFVGMQFVPFDPILIVSDNEQVVDSIKRVNAGYDPAKKKRNSDLWIEIAAFINSHPGVYAQWVRARSYNLGNIRADQIAHKKRRD